MIGTTIGPFRILAKLGAGGMGEVYKARDTNLNRDVALKILPEAVANDPDRLMRFEREAQALAALNHPNIAQIYGVETYDVDAPSGGSRRSGRALVMECVEGADLAERLAQGPMPLDDALPAARQIASALEAAHEAGIVHRDLKPANVKVKPDGMVKVLDFGLAKAFEGDGAGSPQGVGSPSRGQDPILPTMTSPAMTAAGMILGTAAYMAPEQAKGRPVDRRADIWAFGVVVFEMLTGRQLFAAEDVSETIAAVLRNDVPWDALPAGTPVSVRRLLSRCLDRNPQTRLRDIGEARVALERPAADEGTAAGDATPRHGSSLLRVAAGLLAVALVAALASLWRAWAPAPAVPVARFEVTPPAGAALSLANRSAVSMSPDGQRLVFTATSEGVSRLYQRQLGLVDVTPIAGSDGATHPAVSPDGTRVAFFAGGDLKIASFDGTVASAVDKAGPDPRGLCWVDDRTLVYSPDATAGLLKISIDGGDATPLTTLDAERNERTHRWPVAVDGGKAVLFTIGDNSSPDDYETATIGAVIVASGERREVYRGASMALPTSAGHLLLARAGVLSAVAFDADRLTTSGPVVQVLSGVSGDRTTGVAHVAVSRNGTLAYIPGDDQKGSLRRLVWTDAGGDLTPVPGLDPQIYNDIRLSPDGTRLAALVGPTGSGDVWTYDVARGTFTRLTFTGTNAAPVWSPDGKTVYYVSIAGSGLKTELWRRPADGSREAEMVFALDSRAYVTNVGEDAIVFDGYAPNKPLIRVPDGDPAQEETILESPFSIFAAEVSPDGRWLAYQSNETGRYEVYVRDLTPGGGRYQVSTALGEEPHWSRDGTSLYYRADEALMAVPVTTEPTFSAGTPRLLFRGIYNLRSDTGISFTVAPDGRFMMIRPAVDNQTPPVVELVLNWFDELRARTAR